MRISCVAVMLASAFGADIHGADWPQWRYDAGRTAASPEQLPAELHLQWVREYQAPRPAFPGEVRLRYDATYEAVASGNTVFVPSMVTDSVAALDADSGQERWRFFAEGPVRFAPAVAEGRVFIVSDDGYLYCVSADEGKLLWRFRGAPDDRTRRRVMGNSRLVSLFPARGGPLLADGIVYFAAGIWPIEGVYVCAVDAATGETLWCNDHTGILEIDEHKRSCGANHDVSAVVIPVTHHRCRCSCRIVGELQQRRLQRAVITLDLPMLFDEAFGPPCYC